MAKNTERNTISETNKGNKKAIRPVNPLYTDCSIPAKLFFDIAAKKDYSLLGEGSKEQLQVIYEDIAEEYYTLSDEKGLKTHYNTHKKVALLEITIHHTETLLYMLLYTPMTNDERGSVIDVVNAVPKLNANINKETDLLTEIIRVQQQCLGILHNELNIIKPEETKEHVKDVPFVFESELVKICVTLGFQLSANISLYEYVNYRKTAMDIAKQRQKH